MIPDQSFFAIFPTTKNLGSPETLAGNYGYECLKAIKGKNLLNLYAFSY
jgi:hypothetical protein